MLCFQEKTRVLFAKDTEINPSVVLKKLHEILGARGKKGTDRTEQIEYLKDLRRIAEKHNLGVCFAFIFIFTNLCNVLTLFDVIQLNDRRHFVSVSTFEI